MAQKKAAKTRPDSTSSQTPSLADFEQSLGELESLAEQLEGGDISLEESLLKFERGVQLARNCQQVLKQAELRVEQLTQRNGEEVVADFNE